MMLKTREEFLNEAEELDLFNNTTDALNFYRLVQSENIAPAVLIYSELLEKGIGWVGMNTLCGYLTEDDLSLGNEFLDRVLKSRLDDLLVDIDSIPGIPGEYGTYLISDLIKLDENNELHFSNEDTFVMKMAYRAIDTKETFLNKVILDLRANLGGDDFGYMAKLAIYNLFFSKITNSPNSLMVKTLVVNEYKRIENKLKGLVRLSTEITSKETQRISKIGMLGIGTVNEYNAFIDKLQSVEYLSAIGNLLDLQSRRL